MKCCSDPRLFDEDDTDCGCVIEACFNCNFWRTISFCVNHNPEGDQP